ncbi:glucose dehydrogenase [FAD, quinone]-like isoform X2 [Cylas formicarius]|uniref:glucose dehydrogenase [FAD, quinone]-like isoform X2 n=1 Tax=Cylas formicarius TaxID=197179 RepID=UPI0029586EF3|nr:glucose dehydrogenase [FAD, quinone]-like isoform X2 [Cylas formicarius]
MDFLGQASIPCQTNLEGASAHIFLTLINALTASQCTLGSKDQYPADYGPKLVDGEEFDFIVVGAGSAGSVVANKLSENSRWRVLVLEAGGYPSATSDVPVLLFNLQGTNEDWKYLTEKSTSSCMGYVNGQCRWSRGKALGGSSSINAMIYIRGNKGDYDSWADMGNYGWEYANVEKLFRKIENYEGKHDGIVQYGKNGYQPISWYDNNQPITQSLMEGANILGYPTLTEEDCLNPLGYFQSTITIQNGVRANAAKGFLGRVKDRSNLYVAINALVTKIQIDPFSKNATAVELQIGLKKLHLKVKKEVVLSAGALNTPQVLMLSGIGIGLNLQDHLCVPIYVQLDQTALQPRDAAGMVDDLYEYFMYRKGVAGTISLTNLQGFINTKNDSRYPNIQLLHVLHQAGDEFTLPTILNVVGYPPDSIREQLELNKLHPTIHFLLVLLKPKSRGKILLQNQNPREPPLFHSGYLTDPNGEDLETMVESVRFVQKLIQTEPMQKHNAKLHGLTLPNCQGLEFDSDDYWRCYIRNLATTTYHQAGTAKMGPSSYRESVVDPTLRIHGVQNIRVADASVMPELVSGNTNAACLAIGLRAGEIIAEDWENVKEEL